MIMLIALFSSQSNGQAEQENKLGEPWGGGGGEQTLINRRETGIQPKNMTRTFRIGTTFSLIIGSIWIHLNHAHQARY